MERKRNMDMLFFGVCLLYVIKGVQCAHWTTTSLPEGQIIYSCQSGMVTLPWQYELDVGDRVGEVTWYYTGSSQEVMAVVTHGIFVPMATFSNRVSLVGNAGIGLSKLQVGDSGNYSVEVEVISNAGTSVSTLRRSIALIVSDGLMTKDGVLHAVQDEEAVLDPSTGQWSIQLSCGAFLHQDTPPFSVQWLTGVTVVNSTSYSNHHFHLILSNPVQGGLYTCRIPPQNAADVCLHSNVTQAEAVVNINRNDARYNLVIKELQMIKEQDQIQKDQIQFQKDQIQLLKEELEVEKLKTNNLSAVVDKMQNESRQPVAFHAVNLANSRPPVDTPFIFSNVLYNVGGGYDSGSGHFSAPVAGIYFFSATAGSSANSYAILLANNVQLGCSYVYDIAGLHTITVHGVAHLQQGEKAWVNAHGSTYDVGYGSMFSGFLLSRDV